jgi:adenylate kinase family enzyme
MASVTLIGPDGAGKTTLTRKLEASGLLPFRYLYMGVNIAASNVALPTSRFAEWLKARSHRSPVARGESPSVATRTGVRARVRALARLGNRLAEEWFRQLFSWWYQLRGFVVLYDRHFVFDFAPEIEAGAGEGFDRRVHRWCLTHLYPRPGLVIFLDAPGEVLFARKRESTVEELERRRQAFLRQGERLPNFVRVDATRPLEEVYSQVEAQVLAFCGAGRPRATRMRTPARVAPRAGS